MTRPPLCLIAVLALAGCGGGGGSFKDDLSFGTGVDATFQALVGVADSFDTRTTSLVWFRMESSASFEGRFVRLYFNTLEQKDYAGCASQDAHICVSQFAVSTPGTWQVKAYLVKTVIDIGQETLVASHTLTLR